MPLKQIPAEAGALAEALIVWATQTLPDVIAAILLLVAGFWLAGFASRQVDRLFDHDRRVDPTLRGVLTSLVRYSILVVVLVAALSQLGIQTTSILAALGAIGLAIGLALQGTLSNIAAGMMLLWLRPFRVGDYIEVTGAAGSVKEIGLFATELHSWDGIYQFVPNAELWNKRLINYTRLPTRLVEVKFGIAYDDDIDTGKKVLLEVAKADPRVHADPEPQVFVSALGDSAVELSLRVWGITADYWTTLRALNERGKAALEKAGLTIPFPQRDVHIYGSEMPQAEMGGKSK